MNARRLQKEIRLCTQSKDFEFFYDEEGKYGIKQAFYTRFVMEMDEYKGQKHIIRYNLKDFPFKPPSAVFLTPMWHTNVSSTGAVCLDVISHNWSPAMSIVNVQDSISLLMMEHGHSSPFNAEASRDNSTMSKEEFCKKTNNYYYSKLKQLKYIINIKNLNLGLFVVLSL